MVKDAEQYKAEDEKRKQAVEIRNQADAMVYQVDKTMNEFGDKVPEAEKTEIMQAKDELAEALKGDDTENIKAKSEALSTKLHKISEKVYQEAAAAQQAAQQNAGTDAGQQAGGDDTVVDADYKVVDDDDKK